MSSPAGPGAILELIRRGRAVTRAQLMQATGLSRSTLAKRIDALIAHGYIEADDTAESSGGRPAETFAINRETGVMLLAVVGAETAHVALCDMARTPLVQQHIALRREAGPQHFPDTLVQRFDALLAESGRARSDVKGVGIGVSDAVGCLAARGTHTPQVAASGGGDGTAMGDRFAAEYRCPVCVERSINLTAVAEYRIAWPAVTHLLCLDVGDTIGAALIIDGALQRGAQGAAGDIAHLPVGPGDPGARALCRCGNSGCLETHASTYAILRELSARGHRAGDVEAIAELAQNGVHDAVGALQNAGRLIGEAVAVAVNLLNPSLIVLGGDLTRGQSHLLAALRQTVYQRSSATATCHLQIVTSTLGEDAALSGAALLVADAAHAADTVDAQIERFA